MTGCIEEGDDRESTGQRSQSPSDNQSAHENPLAGTTSTSNNADNGRRRCTPKPHTALVYIIFRVYETRKLITTLCKLMFTKRSMCERLMRPAFAYSSLRGAGGLRAHVGAVSTREPQQMGAAIAERFLPFFLMSFLTFTAYSIEQKLSFVVFSSQTAFLNARCAVHVCSENRTRRDPASEAGGRGDRFCDSERRRGDGERFRRSDRRCGRVGCKEQQWLRFTTAKRASR